jgi:Cytotoxic translational repressor of toxin-antitoxin stability system
MYELVVLNSAARELRKFGKPVRTKILTALDMIAENPYIGELLKGDLTTVYSHHLKVTGTEYRIAYQIREEEIIVVILQVGTRENFYQELKKRFK